MQDRADAYALRLLASRGRHADLLGEDMDTLRAKGFSPPDMGRVTAALMRFSDQYWSGSGYPDPRAILNLDAISPHDADMLRAAALRAEASALEQRDRRALELAPLSTPPAPHAPQTSASAPQPKPDQPATHLPLQTRYSDAILDVLDRLDSDDLKAVAKSGKCPNTAERHARQRRRVMEQFVELTGKQTVAALKSEDLSHYVACLSRLPKMYNKSAKDRSITLDMLMERGDDLPPDQVGLSAATVNRNLSFISGTLRKARKDGIRPAEVLELDLYRQKETTQARDQRPPFTTEDVYKLFQHPTFRGRQSAARPHNPGNEIEKDALYWAPLIAASSGARREEICGMRLEEVHLDGPIPYFEIVPNANRNLKTPQSKRLVPIHSQVLSVGFAEYCTGLRKAGQTDLFPDLRPTTNEKTFGDNLYHRWRTMLDRQLGVDVGGKVFHSFRHYVISTLTNEFDVETLVVKDIVGHLTGDITLDRYRELSILAKMREAIERLPKVI
jgi:integrase